MGLCPATEVMLARKDPANTLSIIAAFTISDNTVNTYAVHLLTDEAKELLIASMYCGRAVHTVKVLLLAYCSIACLYLLTLVLG